MILYIRRETETGGETWPPTSVSDVELKREIPDYILYNIVLYTPENKTIDLIAIIFGSFYIKNNIFKFCILNLRFAGVYN